jgi:hypothetical protein
VTVFGQPTFGALDYNIGIVPEVRTKHLAAPQSAGDSAVVFVRKYSERKLPRKERNSTGGRD